MTTGPNNAPHDSPDPVPTPPGPQTEPFAPESGGSLPQAAGAITPELPTTDMQPTGTPSPEPRDPAWNGWDVVRIVIMGLTAVVATLIVLVLIAPGPTLRDKGNWLAMRPELPMVGQMVAYLLLLGYMYLLVTRERRQSRFWDALRWNWPSGASFYLLAGVLIQVIFIIAEQFLPLPKETPFEELLRRRMSVYLIAVFSVTIGPLIEELFFRGFLYPVLRRSIGVSAAILATALPFALMHAAQYGYSWASVLLIFVLGVVLTGVRERKNSLAAPFLIHVAYNGSIVALLFLIPYQRR